VAQTQRVTNLMQVGRKRIAPYRVTMLRLKPVRNNDTCVVDFPFIVNRDLRSRVVGSPHPVVKGNIGPIGGIGLGADELKVDPGNVGPGFQCPFRQLLRVSIQARDISRKCTAR